MDIHAKSYGNEVRMMNHNGVDDYQKLAKCYDILRKSEIHWTGGKHVKVNREVFQFASPNHPLESLNPINN